MSLSKQHLSYHKHPVTFDVEALGRALKERCPEVIFALLLGSSKDGLADIGSDIDIALYVNGKPSFKLYGRVAEIAEKFAPGVNCDVGCLNNTEPVYRYESLKGRLLFTRDDETYCRFYSITCREYERQLFHYEKQYRYRMQRYEAEGA